MRPGFRGKRMEKRLLQELYEGFFKIETTAEMGKTWENRSFIRGKVVILKFLPG